MKLPAIITHLSLLYLLPHGAFSQDAVDPFLKPGPKGEEPEAVDLPQLPKTILLTYQTFTLPKAAAYDLILKHKPKDDLLKAVQQAYEAKEATLDHLLIIRTKSGQRAKVEAINEFPYPTDFDPPQLPQTLHLGPISPVKPVKNPDPAPTPPPPTPPVPPTPAPVPVPAPTGTTAPFVEPTKEAAAKPIPFEGSTSNSGLGLITSNSPTTFTVRNIGQSMEVDPVLSEDGVTVDVTIAPEFVSYIGDVPGATGITLPVFVTQKLNTSMALQSGHSMFVGTQSKPLRTGAPNSNTQDLVSLSFISPKVVTIPPPPVRKEIAQHGAQLMFRWENISLPKADAYKLLTSPFSDAALHERLLAMIHDQGARLDTVLCLVTKSGQRAKVEQVDEFPYGTDFDVPQISQTLTITDEHLLKLLYEEGGAVGKRAQGLPAANLGFGNISGVTPTTFTIRNIGETMEIDPVMGEDGSTIDITIAPESVRVVHELKYNGTTQPIFETQKFNTSSTLRKDLPHLLGTMNKPYKSGAPGGNQEDRIVLTFITAEDP